MSSVQVEGVDRLLGRLGQIEARGVRRLMLKVLVEGAKPIRREVRSAAPVGPTGNLQKGVRYKASRKSTGNLSYMIGPFGKGTSHRHLVVGGHEVVGHQPAKVRTGKRTKTDDFVARGKAAAEGSAFDAVEASAKSHFEDLVR